MLRSATSSLAFPKVPRPRLATRFRPEAEARKVEATASFVVLGRDEPPKQRRSRLATAAVGTAAGEERPLVASVRSSWIERGNGCHLLVTPPEGMKGVQPLTCGC